MITVLLFIALIPLCLYFLNVFTFLVLSVISLMGVFYSLSFHYGKKLFRIKNVFLLKNIFIGIAWGSLILIGSGEFSDPVIKTLFLFSSVQVMIGSIIRDVPDEEKDKAAGVKSFPVVLGKKNTFIALHIFNFASWLTVLVWAFEGKFKWILLIVVLWRLINLIGLNLKNNSAFWGQKFNLFTCVLIFLISFIFWYDGLI
ncbi:MAG: UbiA family prenyltransferase [Crocinitomicaceae bacterium]|nr:UbiA family prenyltransferase [Crocinitomicaceae bacterium]